MSKKPEPIRVTEHAVLRYLERAMGFNVEAVRQHIFDTCSGPAGIGAVCVRSEGLRFEIVNNTVTTITPDRAAPGMTARERNQNFIERNRREV